MSDFLYSVEREYPVAISTLWEAWTHAEQLQQWYSGIEHSVVPHSIISDARVGGVWSNAVHVPDIDFTAYFYGTYSKVLHKKRLVHSLAYTEDLNEFAARDPDAPHHRIEIDFQDRGHCSWVKFSQFRELPDGEADRAKDGIEEYFDNLEIFLSHEK